MVFVYDICDRGSFVNVGNWFNDVRQYGAGGVEKILVGNKCDIGFSDLDERMVTEAEGRHMAALLGARFIETSAKNNVNVERMFLTLVSDILAKKASAAVMSRSVHDRSLMSSANSSLTRRKPDAVSVDPLANNTFHGRTRPSSEQRRPTTLPLQPLDQHGSNAPFRVGVGNTLKGGKGGHNRKHRTACCKFY